ncbi:beta-ketoacyl synthase N-terminal-like domain-containing protein [Amycolatopsis nigrescens]|uniref:beta-ketoacyl synthase N-terminal-like domain-containing protein n=1 Tax=Amycolatopsis nigrescens TaxID=381445 RepID=UPI000380D56B|nr:beta-ketoacyl synthase N-terminal-like domain-containing protein [Amycolatopsis nigrescens]
MSVEATEPRLALGSLGMRLPGADDLSGLLDRRTPVPTTSTRLPGLEGDDTIETAIAAVAEIGLPETVPRRKLRDLGREALLALAAAGDVCGALPSTERVGVVWASANSGLAEYVQLCHEAAVLEPGLVRPTLGPRSAFNGPCADLSITFGLTGPQLTLIGGPAAGASAVLEARLLVRTGQCDRVLVGGSAAVTPWSLKSRDTEATTPAEGALGLMVVPANADEGPRVTRHLRIQWNTARGRERLRALLSAGTDVVLSGIEPADLADLDPNVVHQVEHGTGELGAAGGVLAVALAAAQVEAARSSRCVAVTADPDGAMTAVELG